MFPFYDKKGNLAFKHFPAYEVLPFWADDDHTILDSAIRLYPQEVWDGYTKKIIERVELFKTDGLYRYIYLILRAAERGLKPQPASPAVLQLSITPTTLHLPMNTRFSIGELNYYVSADRGSGKYEITCETAGEAGNDYTGTVIPIEYVDGLETCSISAVVIPGEDEEDTEVFRQRYMDIKGCDAVAFGDEMADVGMFSLCQYSVAMGNAPSSVKIHAKYTTAANNENGVAAFLEKCLHEQFS